MSRWVFLACILAVTACAELQKATMTEEERSQWQAAERLEKSGNWAGAAAMYRRMLAKESPPDDVYGKLAAAYRKSGRHEEAILILRDAQNHAPDNTKILSQLGYALIDAGQSEEAVAIFDQLTAIEPDNAMFYNGKAVAFDSAGNHVAAQELYQTALSLAPDSSTIKNNLALSLILNGQPREAIALLEPLVERPDANATMRQNLALAYGLAGEKDQALEVSRKDLSPEQAKENLRFYEKYKRLSKQKPAAE